MEIVGEDLDKHEEDPNLTENDLEKTQEVQEEGLKETDERVDSGEWLNATKMARSLSLLEKFDTALGLDSTASGTAEVDTEAEI